MGVPLWLYDKLMNSDAVAQCPYCPRQEEFPEMLAHLKLDEALLAQEAQEVLEDLMSEIDVTEDGDPILEASDDDYEF